MARLVFWSTIALFWVTVIIATVPPVEKGILRFGKNPANLLIKKLIYLKSNNVPCDLNGARLKMPENQWTNKCYGKSSGIVKAKTGSTRAQIKKYAQTASYEVGHLLLYWKLTELFKEINKTLTQYVDAFNDETKKTNLPNGKIVFDYYANKLMACRHKVTSVVTKRVLKHYCKQIYYDMLVLETAGFNISGQGDSA